MIFQKQKTAILAYKKKKSKKSTNRQFSRGVNKWFWSKNGHFSTFFVQEKQARKTVFMIFQNEKTPFSAIKTSSPKSRKIDIFPKRLTHAFGPKMAIFPTFLFRQYRPEKKFFMIFQNEKTPFQAIKTSSPKSRRIDIFPMGLTHGFCPKMAILNFFFRQYTKGKCLL